MSGVGVNESRVARIYFQIAGKRVVLCHVTLAKAAELFPRALRLGDAFVDSSVVLTIRLDCTVGQNISGVTAANGKT